MADLATNIQSVQERIQRACERAGRRPEEVTLVAVSKTFPADAVISAYGLGIRHFGENRVEEAGGKIRKTRPVLESVQWHMIGTLQHRKVKDAVTLFDIIESIDSVQLAQRLESRLAITSRRMPILIEMNVGGEPSKHGFSMDSRRTFVRAFEQIATLPHLEVRGLMTIAPMLSDPEDARPFFRTMRELSSHLRDNFPDQTLEHLSMGMTDDFEVAIDEGATIVRIGRAIFGKRI